MPFARRTFRTPINPFFSTTGRNLECGLAKLTKIEKFLYTNKQRIIHWFKSAMVREFSSPSVDVGLFLVSDHFKDFKKCHSQALRMALNNKSNGKNEI